MFNASALRAGESLVHVDQLVRLQERLRELFPGVHRGLAACALVLLLDVVECELGLVGRRRALKGGRVLGKWPGLTRDVLAPILVQVFPDFPLAPLDLFG